MRIIVLFLLGALTGHLVAKAQIARRRRRGRAVLADIQRRISARARLKYATWRIVIEDRLEAAREQRSGLTR